MTVVQAAKNVPALHYTHHERRGPTPHRSNPAVIYRELENLEVSGGMNVAEIGTGSGYSGAVLAHLVGRKGHVTSLDIDPYLSRWTPLLHHQAGVRNVDCRLADGTTGLADNGPYDRLVAWCTPPLLPDTWVQQIVPGGIIVTALPVTDMPHATVVAKLRITSTGSPAPEVERLFHGAYIDSTASPKADLSVPDRWVEWEYRRPTPAWISLRWRDQDDSLHTGARRILDRLLTDAHTESYGGREVDWYSWRAFTAALDDPQLTTVSLAPDTWAIGHSTPHTVAVLQQDGTILADDPGSGSLEVLRDWLAHWEKAGRPAVETFKPALEQCEGGWRLRLYL